MFRSFERLPFAAVSVFGAWAIYAQTCVLLNASFESLTRNIWIALVLALGIYVVLFRQRKPSANEDQYPTFPSVRYAALLAAVAAIAIGLLLPRYQLFAVIVYIVSVAFLLRSAGHEIGENVAPCNGDAIAGSEKWVLICVSLAAFGLTLFLHRANWDDAYYVNAIATALDHPGLPLLKYDGLHGVPGLEINQVAWRLQTYELLVAAISRLANIDHRDLYYVYLPPIWALLSIPAHWVLVRRFTGRASGIAVLLIFIILIAWGEGRRTFGSFAYIRLFQGKAVFLTVMMPLVINSALEFAGSPNRKNWARMFITCFAACMFTANAYVVLPVAVGLVLVSAFGISRNGIKQSIVGSAATLFCPIVLWLVMHDVTQSDVDRIRNEFYVFRGTQGMIVLVLLGLAPFLTVIARLNGAKWLARYCLIFFAVFMSGLLLPYFGAITSSVFSWRLFWAVPVPTIAAVGATAIIVLAYRAWRDRKRAIAGAFILGLMLVSSGFAYTGRATFRLGDLHWPSANARHGYAEALGVLEVSTPEDYILAPYAIAVPLAGFRGAPSLTVARDHYLSRFSTQWGEAETKRRKRLMKIIRGRSSSPQDIEWAQTQLTMGDITKVVIRNDDPELFRLRSMLQTIGRNVRTIGNWEVWALHKIPAP